MRNVLIGFGAALGAGVAVRSIVRATRRIDLSGRVVVITGGSRGLGLDLARVCATRGAKLALLARDPEELERAADSLQRHFGATVFFYPCDVSMQTMVDDAIRSIVRDLGTIDVLINNAGIIQVGPMREMLPADYEEAMATHFRGPLYTTLAVLPIMRGRRGGRIVNIASIGGKVAASHLLPYAASKFALVGLSTGMRAELAKEKIYVTTVSPGLFRSGSAANAMFKGRADEEHAWFTAASVMPILSMDPMRLAKKIIIAAEHGQAELVLPWITNVQAKFAALAPNLTSEIVMLIDRFLPSSGGIQSARLRGKETSDEPTPRFALRRSHRAAETHNE